MKKHAKPTPTLRRDAGVTLVEMMVVIVIIGLIAAVVAINVLPAQDTARAEKARADIRTMEQALELFRLDQSRYPATDEGLEILAAQPTADATGLTKRSEPYVRRLPSDPWGRPYNYVQPGQEGRPYDLYSLGADGREGGEGVNADISNGQ
jgi:general secretion pathway protein G